MVLLGILIVLGGILSFMAINSKNIVLAVVAGGSWIGALADLIASPPTELPAGSNGQQILVIVLFGAGMGIIANGIYQTVINRRERSAEVEYYSRREDVAPRNFQAYEEARGRSTRNGGDESLESYRARMYLKARPWRARGRG